MRKKSIVVVILTLAILMIATNAFAYSTFPNNYTLNGGVGNYGYNNRAYFVTSSASGYSTLIGDAISSWDYTTSRLGSNYTTPISIVRTYTQSESVFDLYQITFSGDYNTIAQTNLYLYSTLLTPNGQYPSQNWGWSRIDFNSNVMPGLSQFNEQGTIAHELGHGMGLAHVSNTVAIMCQLGYGRTVNLPMQDDCDGINFLY
ncbi:MAG: matrixin family metalloprotease [Desulfitobacteriaceae bacterium]